MTIHKNPATTGHAELDALVDDYMRAWSTTDDSTRHDLVARVYATDAEFFSSESGDLRLTGHLAIENNIRLVNERDIQGNCLTINHTGTSINHRMIRATWQMLAPNGAAVLAGMDVLVIGDLGKIAQDHIFIG